MKMLSVADVLKRYREENLPEFSGVELMFVNQFGIFGNAPIHIACIRGDADEVKTLINGGANINAVGEFWNTPLHEAVGQGNIKITKLLISRGCDLSVKNCYGDTPFDIACINNRPDIKKLLTLRNE